MEIIGVEHILLDIEGTVLPISFVRERLFGYVRENLDDFLTETWTYGRTVKAVQLITEFQERNEESPMIDGSQNSVIESVLWQMDRDVKDAGLKYLQSLIWERGYHKGLLVADLFDDVKNCLEQWVRRDFKVSIYSSGDIEAQKLLFQHTSQGSLANLLTSYHDLKTAGSKVEPLSYEKIAQRLELRADKILFVTDIHAEYEAATAAGLKAVVIVRPGNVPLSEDQRMLVPVIMSLEDIILKS